MMSALPLIASSNSDKFACHKINHTRFENVTTTFADLMHFELVVFREVACHSKWTCCLAFDCAAVNMVYIRACMFFVRVHLGMQPL